MFRALLQAFPATLLSHPTHLGSGVLIPILWVGNRWDLVKGTKQMWGQALNWPVQQP